MFTKDPETSDTSASTMDPTNEEIGNSYEDVKSNTPELAEVEPTKIRKLNNENVVPILQEHTEELKKKLQEGDDLITSLQKKLEEKESEMNEMEANFLSKNTVTEELTITSTSKTKSLQPSKLTITSTSKTKSLEPSKLSHLNLQNYQSFQPSKVTITSTFQTNSQFNLQN